MLSAVVTGVKRCSIAELLEFILIIVKENVGPCSRRYSRGSARRSRYFRVRYIEYTLLTV